jgi:hypothetical protein
MNKTETLAYRWLRRVKGYGRRDITFGYRQNPDFIAADGLGYEVKLVRTGSVTFTVLQLIALERHPDVHVLFWDDGAKGPTLEVPFPELPIPGYWRQYRIILVDQRHGLSFHRPLTDEEKANYENERPTHVYPGAVKAWTPRGHNHDNA